MSEVANESNVSHETVEPLEAVSFPASAASISPLTNDPSPNSGAIASELGAVKAELAILKAKLNHFFESNYRTHIDEYRV